jgi:hypothetical protein
MKVQVKVWSLQAGDIVTGVGGRQRTVVSVARIGQRWPGDRARRCAVRFADETVAHWGMGTYIAVERPGVAPLDA